jgi:hypothetical protein
MLKKNPFMSMWLSAANRMVGTLRSQATAQVRRQVTTATTEVVRNSAKPLRPKPSSTAKAPPVRARRRR